MRELTSEEKAKNEIVRINKECASEILALQAKCLVDCRSVFEAYKVKEAELRPLTGEEPVV